MDTGDINCRLHQDRQPGFFGPGTDFRGVEVAQISGPNEEFDPVELLDLIEELEIYGRDNREVPLWL